MRCKSIIILFLYFFVTSLQADDRVEQLQNQMQIMVDQMEVLQHELEKLKHEQQNQVTTTKHDDEVLSSEIKSNTSNDDKKANEEGSSYVDLDTHENQSIESNDEDHILSRPWWRNFDIHGFGAVGFYDTGSAGTREHGSFEIKEASLFVEAAVWKDISFFVELQTNRLGKDDDLFTRTGEVYAHFKDIPIGESTSLGMKLGRIDIPFGEEYLWQDAIDNPLITYSAAYPYGWDEGVLLYSSFHGLNWIFAVTDGTDARSSDENSEKAFNLKFYGNPWEPLYLSLSLMSNGDGTKSAFEFGGSHFRPIGAPFTSALGDSPSTEVESNLIELASKYNFDLMGNTSGYVALTFGAAEQDDKVSSFDRDFMWFSIEPYLKFTNSWYTVLRYSEIGTYDNDEHYNFYGKIYAGGDAVSSFDIERFQRLGIGLGWAPNPHIRAKFEIGKDWFTLIDASPLSADNEDREFAGFEMAVGF
ncbi:MAG: hypothetical protein ACR2PU_03055 [Gammaproteobacteria bacterium]